MRGLQRLGRDGLTLLLEVTEKLSQTANISFSEARIGYGDLLSIEDLMFLATLIVVSVVFSQKSSPAKLSLIEFSVRMWTLAWVSMSRLRPRVTWPVWSM